MNNLKTEKKNKRFSSKDEFKDISVFTTAHKELKALSVDLSTPMYELATKAINDFVLKNKKKV